MKPGCNPGGTGIPYNITNKLVRDRLKVGVDGPAYTNALFVKKVGATNANYFIGQLEAYIPSLNAQAFEIDMFKFEAPTEYMMGTQCEPGVDWQVWGNTWVHTGIPCDLVIGKNQIQIFTHIAGGMLHYDLIVVNGEVHPINLVEPSNPLPFGWGNTSGIQVQVDVNKSGAGVVEYFKNVTFVEIP